MQRRETVKENKELDPHIDHAITDEDLRRRIREILPDPKPAPKWKRIITHPLFLLIIGFFLSNYIGAQIANKYNAKQAELETQRNIHLKELESQRSFSDELNKIRLGKIAEVWESLYQYEAAVEDIMKQIKVESSSPGEGNIVISNRKGFRKIYEQSKNLKKEVLRVLNKNRLWLEVEAEDDSYSKLKEYTGIIFDYYFAEQTRQDFEMWKKKRDEARVSINEIREKMLKK